MPATDRQPVIECLSLTKVFKDFWGRDKVLAVDNLDLSVYPGEVFGLLGPNGSGKSTTIKILLGLLYPTRGRARVFGRPPTDTAVKSRIGFMPEESYLYRFLNARETLDFYGRLFNLDGSERGTRTEQLIDMIGLKKAARRQVGQYSKGMARRIGLAQALINDPDLLILDEPTTGLDPIGSRQIKDVIIELKKRGKTVVLSSHLLADVEDLCDRVAVLYGGRLRAMGTVHELLARREVTQINAERLEPAVIERVRGIIERDGGRRVISVDHPTDRLEDFFLRIVAQAQHERLETSGAESRTGVSAFLSAAGAAPSAGRELIEELSRPSAPAPEPSAQPTPIETPDSQPDRGLIESLATGRPAGDDSKPAAVATKEEEEGPKEVTPQPQADRSVLERLSKGGG
ncbi:MAG: ATP-binding cassette domain-containing protein [Phycisphaerae bacterium]|nr:ATP-binding cassette domain-containing protein [Phycisphaerae bacterium]